jgi:hypothetical protein
MKTLGLENNEIIWPDAIIPAISTMNTLEAHLSASFYLRREIFVHGLEKTHHTRMYFL